MVQTSYRGKGKTTDCAKLPATITFSRQVLRAGANNSKEAPSTTESFVRTRAALGVLKAATQKPYPLIAFVPEQLFRQIKDYPWNDDLAHARCSPFMSYYTLLPADQAPGDHPPPASPRAEQENQEVADAVTKLIYYKKILMYRIDVYIPLQIT